MKQEIEYDVTTDNKSAFNENIDLSSRDTSPSLPHDTQRVSDELIMPMTTLDTLASEHTFTMSKQQSHFSIENEELSMLKWYTYGKL